MLPFLRSQKLYILKPDVASRAAVHPEQFHASRRQQGEVRGDDPAKPDGDSWTELPRADLLAGSFNDQCLHRVALTTDAGLGKTYNLKWLRLALNGRARGLRAFMLTIGALAAPADLSAKRLAPAVRSAPGNRHLGRDGLCAVLERLRRGGQLVLIFAGLDMAGEDSVK